MAKKLTLHRAKLVLERRFDSYEKHHTEHEKALRKMFEKHAKARQDMHERHQKARSKLHAEVLKGLTGSGDPLHDHPKSAR